MSMVNRVCQVVRSGAAIRATLSIVALQMPRTLPMAHRRGLTNLALQARTPLIAAQRRFAQDVKGQTPQQIEARVLKVCKDFDKLASNADKVTLTASFVKDLGLDSLDRIELMMAFEDEFGFEIPEAEAEKLQTPGDILKYIVNKK